MNSEICILLLQSQPEQEKHNTTNIIYIKPSCSSNDGTTQYLPADNSCYITNFPTIKLKNYWSPDCCALSEIN